ncbi:hypothetical protein ER308_10475 [Egibacter rhizosphaerae]|uniref:Fe/B12 periplasmic-binding domain-containing protein n=1 Tax=Egibacter rhizosphaerae TaxID=1670831 RepID=A0A411YLB7_9ACTN|nr:hypothetical protein ER308_10475 [Egibacter rhizosphaerae]
MANCDREVTVDQPPERLVAVNTASIENLLALGLGDRMVAASGSIDDVSEELQPELDGVDTLDTGGDDYPSLERIIELEPDFLYSVYPSTFRDDGLASRDELDDLGVATYLAPSRCPDRDEDEPLSFEEIWGEYTDLGELLDAEEAAEQLVAEQRDEVEQARDEVEQARDEVDGNLGMSAFWWDVGTADPLTGACCGAPAMIMDELGLINIFGDLDGHWSDASWEHVVEEDPDVIVMVDFGDDDIERKREFIAEDATLSQLRAFEEDRVVVLPFPHTTPGLHNVEALRTLSAELAEDQE